MEKFPEPDERDPEPDEDVPVADDPDVDEVAEPFWVAEDDVELESEEASGFPAAVEAVAFGAVDDVALADAGLLPAVDVAVLAVDDEDAGDAEPLRAELEPGVLLLAVLSIPTGLEPLDLASADALSPDFGTLDLDDALSGFAPTFSAFKSMVTGRLAVPDEEDVVLLPGLSDEPDPLPPDEDAPPEDLLSVAI
ncbi:MAG: hypothetical protein K5905_11805 [Roseibium sp.]|uniref:hypothetical protein n=1 Tax=Roseibium sp. TaxID=1936156 RepID=UPI002621C47C|nr:hypothetical protein [Roseibium sp.]MCV0426150.1 hypothetical protein [Roseibium sp.]